MKYNGFKQEEMKELRQLGNYIFIKVILWTII